ncbi:MAG: PKD domain-containing protein, partial [Myxococcota bacterium]|nr:PKD domain-containing protein [Myxococcota bacterium]
MSPLLILSFIGCAPQDAEVSAHFWTWLASNSSAAIGEDNLTDIADKATVFECSGRGWDTVEERYEDGYIGPRNAEEAAEARYIGGACELDEDGEPVEWCTEEIQQKWADQCNGTATTVGVLDTFMADDGYYAIQGDVDPWRTEALINGENDLQLTVHHYLEKGQDFRFTFSIAPDFEPTRCISTENGAEIQKVDGASWVEKWSEDEGDYFIYYLNAGTAQPTGSEAAAGDILYLTTDWLTGYGFSKFAGEEFNSVANTFAAAIPDSIRASCQANMDNVPPLADAGADVLLEVGETVTLTGAATIDLDGDPLTFVWLPDDDVANEPSEGVEYVFLAEVPGTYTFTLAASDGAATSNDEVVVVVPDSNATPVCDMGIDILGDIGTPVAISGSATDPDGDALGYRWSVIAAPVDDNGTPDDTADDIDAVTSFASATADSTTFEGDLPGTYVLGFEACEGGDCEADDDVVCTRTLNVTLDDPAAPAANHPPLCQVNIDQVAIAGDVIVLDGTGTVDPDGDDLVYEWTVSDRPSSSASRDIESADQLVASYTPTTAGIHGISLTATEADDGDDTTEAL